MTLLKRSKSLADLFRPRSRSSGRAAAAAAAAAVVNSHSNASQTIASSCSDADSSLPATDAYARQANLRSSSSSPTSTRRPPPPPMIRTNTGASNADMSRSGTVEDILTAYYAESPTKSRHTPISPQVQQYSQRQQQQQQSPTRTRGPAALGQPLPKRMDSSGSAFQDGDDDDDDDREDSIRQVLPSLPHHDTELARARKEAEANKLQAQQLKSSQRSSRSGRPSQNRSKSSNDLDLIDRLDISGLYGGGGFIRHEGPYAAASTKGQGANAPINAFDPSAFSLAPSQPARRPSKRNVSNGAASGRSAGAMIGGLDDPASRSLLSPYAAAAMVPTMSTSSTSSAAGGTGGSSSEVSLGFPARHPDGKGQQLQEIYGVRDAEAWEDYGRARYDDSSVGTGDASGAASGAASRESVLPGGPVSKEDRMQRAQSIWDIEATLKAGKPVGASNAPPPVPVMPQTWGSPSAGSEFSASTSTSPSLSTNNHNNNNNKPKRSKSLAARFRAGRKNPTNPLSDGDSPGPPGGGEDGRHAGTAYESDGARSVPVSPTEDRRGRNEWPLGASVPASMGSSSTAPHSHPYPYPSGAVTSPPTSSNGHGHGGGPVEQLEIRTQAIKFDESLSSPTLERTSAGMMSRSLTDEGLASPTSASGGKKGHGLKRLFSTKRKA